MIKYELEVLLGVPPVKAGGFQMLVVVVVVRATGPKRIALFSTPVLATMIPHEPGQKATLANLPTMSLVAAPTPAAVPVILMTLVFASVKPVTSPTAV